MGLDADITIIRVSENGYSVNATDGYEAYSGNETSVTIDGLNLDTTTYYYRAWSENAYGYSVGYAQAKTGGDMILLLLFGFLGLGLTFGFFWKRSGFLAYGAAGMWVLLGFQSFQASASLSPIEITDTYMGLFWLCIAFVIGCALLPTVMREKPSKDDIYVDEFDEVTGEKIPREQPRQKKRRSRGDGLFDGSGQL